MRQTEMELRNKLVVQLTDISADLAEIKSRFVDVQNEVALNPKPTQSEVWLLKFLTDYGLPEIDDWIRGVATLLNDPSQLFGSQAIYWIGSIQGMGRAFDGVDWARWPKLQDASNRSVLLASSIHRSMYKYRNPATWSQPSSGDRGNQMPERRQQNGRPRPTN